MADASTAAPSADSAMPRKGKKTVVLVLVMLALEAAVIVGAMMFLGGGPAEVSAVQLAHGDETQAGDRIVETAVLNGRLPNNKSGAAYIYPTEVFVQTRERHAEKVAAEIEQFQNEIKADITAIWRSAEPQFFQEPRLENLTRKVQALLHERFGVDKERNEPIVHKVVIVMSSGFRIDG